MAQTVKNLPAMQDSWVDPWVGKIPWRREWLHTPKGQRSLAGRSPLDHKELDTTE